jgi:hypothetical protein
MQPPDAAPTAGEPAAWWSDEADPPAVLAIDPGGTTGWCVLQVHPAALVDDRYSILGNIQLMTAGEVTGSEARQVYELLNMAREWPSAAIVVEDFILRNFQQSRDLLAPVRITAALKWSLWCGLTVGDKTANKVSTFPDRPIRPVYTQTPEEAKTTCSDERLKSWHLYAASSPHARDAKRHALLFMRRTKAKRGLRELAWPAVYSQVTASASGVAERAARNGHSK